MVIQPIPADWVEQAAGTKGSPAEAACSATIARGSFFSRRSEGFCFTLWHIPAEPRARLLDLAVQDELLPQFQL
jgi:hypothetical protein